MLCSFNLESDTLYTVKWYKGLQEFFRYVPKEMPHITVFGPLASKVDITHSNQHNLILKDVQHDLAGRYRCEVSADAPSFHTELLSSYMHVVTLPQGNPSIHVEKLRYAVGDTVRGNCTVPPGNPTSNVTWTVNEHRVNSSFLSNISANTGENLQITIAGLDFEIIPDSFSNGRLHITCRANLFHLYQAEADIILEEERPRLASVLGTRESSYIGTAAKRSEDWIYMGVVVNLILCGLR
ncbi:uncharacterized protein LOC107272902 isoform X2 [Cephus cinctus]|nr:uncharacterized protein LOC107272902 isoform X2 [Cephus cinctus]